MNRELQNRIWACLSYAERESLKATYYANLGEHLVDDLSKERASIMAWILGKHNLTSDTEPEELLYVERKKVQEIYQEGLTKHDCYTKIRVLDDLFGDKCLPDPSCSEKPNNCTIPSAGSGAQGTTPPAYKLDVKEKAKEPPLCLSDEELDNIIFELIRIRDNRRESNRELAEVLGKLTERKEGEK